MSFNDTIEAGNSFQIWFNDNGLDIIKFIGRVGLLYMIYRAYLVLTKK